MTAGDEKKRRPWHVVVPFLVVFDDQAGGYRWPGGVLAMVLAVGVAAGFAAGVVVL